MLASEEQLIMIIQDNTEFKEKKRKLFPNLLRFVKFIIVLKITCNRWFPYCVFKNGERKAPKQRKSFMKVSIELWRLQPPLLSKQVKDDVAFTANIEAVMYNFRHLFSRRTTH